MSDLLDMSTREAARTDAELAVFEYDDARTWFADHHRTLRAPLAVEVWVFDADLERVLLVEHRWRGWVPPGGKVESGETPRQAAGRELFEETGIRAALLAEPAAVAVRSYHPDWPSTLGLSYAAVAGSDMPVRPEAGQAAAWMSVHGSWSSAFPDDGERMQAYLRWLRGSDHGSS
jgi:8-oxo-dGTP diphosphatase